MAEWSYGFSMVFFFYFVGRWGGAIIDMLRAGENDTERG